MTSVQPPDLHPTDVLVGPAIDWVRKLSPQADAYAGIPNPGYDEPQELNGQKVKILGVLYEVLGVETFSLTRPYPQQMRFGLVLRKVPTA